MEAHIKQIVLRIFRNTANGLRMLGKGLMSYGLLVIGGKLSGIMNNDLATITLLLAGFFFWTIGDMTAEEQKSATRGGDPPTGN